MCTKAFWLRLYLPPFPISPSHPPLPHRRFDHCPFFHRPHVFLPFPPHTSPSLFSSFISLPPWVSSRLWSASQTHPSHSPFLFFLCSPSIFLPLSLMHLKSLFLHVSSLHYSIHVPPSSLQAMLSILHMQDDSSFTCRYWTPPSHPEKAGVQKQICPEMFIDSWQSCLVLIPLWSSTVFSTSLIRGQQLADTRSCKKRELPSCRG